MSADHYVAVESSPGHWEFSTPIEVRAGFQTQADAQERAGSVEAYDRMLAAAAAKNERKGKGPHARRLLAYFESLGEVVS